MTHQSLEVRECNKSSSLKLQHHRCQANTCKHWPLLNPCKLIQIRYGSPVQLGELWRWETLPGSQWLYSHTASRIPNMEMSWIHEMLIFVAPPTPPFKKVVPKSLESLCCRQQHSLKPLLRSLDSRQRMGKRANNINLFLTIWHRERPRCIFIIYNLYGDSRVNLRHCHDIILGASRSLLNVQPRFWTTFLSLWQRLASLRAKWLNPGKITSKDLHPCDQHEES